ncbi:glutamyl-tRNA synthetase class Ic [Gluconacetobacter diazotrophicus PA1 5]|uniref:tRNA glutamyl-Q(34) synthetase GluQRS n=1 Tax=Gluconacetobacter diazotrophicus TaxID=33996 RepID=UPI000173D5C4|nr:tRNA glutamyl-Q(34) synthetase GluQRS [Gluconacetobacter diazotrophicus]ACI52970.1 glutamyl-tRNA synthetase class Ic [Gluconacetobacter diazotrophicus PA1 5]TWB00108.1 glutamyl-Q tRNA(Asp) synthetase [Gluconacetobacter diazotrophicus]
MTASSCFRGGKTVTTRFAPSPTGYLHLGHAASVLTAWRHARESDGRFLLRIEDIDPGRCRPDYTDAIVEDLAWLGIRPDGAVRLQSDHMADYRRVLDALAQRGLLYPCFCTRADIRREAAEAAHAPHRAPDGTLAYGGTCRALSAAERADRIAAGQAHVLRLDMARAVHQAGSGIMTWHERGHARGQGVLSAPVAPFGDVVLARKDCPASYHLCVTHDDALQGVSLVTRGEDLRPATAVHRLLQILMGWPAPEYAHHPLLLDADGRRLAKRDRAQTLRALREAGQTAAAVRAAAMGGAPLPI